jgi:hypothetical protein
MIQEPNNLKAQLVGQLMLSRQSDQTALAYRSEGAPIDVPATGKVLAVVYEQLRNAAENTEENLLLNRAIRRFAKRTLFRNKKIPDDLGHELIVELVQASYFQNRSIGSETAVRINHIFKTYMSSYDDLRKAHVDGKKAKSWTLTYISLEIENLLSPHSGQQAIINMAYQHFLKAIDKQYFSESADINSFESCLYIALCQALLKSDIDVVRYQLFVLNKFDPKDTDNFINFNSQVDRLYIADLTIRLKYIVNRYGAAFRVLKTLIDNRPDVPEILNNQKIFMDQYRAQINSDYFSLKRRLTRGLIKSIIFLVITKAIIGIAIEVPYDLATKGHVSIFPLIVNLLFPPIYMISLKLSLRSPTQLNSEAIYNYMDTLLYGNGDLPVKLPNKGRKSRAKQLLYTLLFLIPVSITVYILQRIGFNLVQMAIFLTFFSTASFLGFRLSVLVRELELTTTQTGLIGSLIDSFYLPFIIVGQWISKKYSKVNLIAQFLDYAIELPLKASLSSIRKSIRFLNEKRDKLY